MRILTTNEIIDLTGFTQPGKQSKWLNQQGIKHWINGKGEVKVSDTAVDEAVASKQQAGPQPKFEALRQAS